MVRNCDDKVWKTSQIVDSVWCLGGRQTVSHDIEVTEEVEELLFIQHECYFKYFNGHIYYAFTNTNKCTFLFYLFCIRQSTAVYHGGGITSEG